MTDVITDLALEWLETERDESKPFVLMVQHKAPHREWMPGPDHLHDMEGVDLPEPATLFDDYSGRGRASTMQEMTIKDHLRPMDLKLAMPEWMMRMTPEERAAWDKAYETRNEAFRALDLAGAAQGGQLRVRQVLQIANLSRTHRRRRRRAQLLGRRRR